MTTSLHEATVTSRAARDILHFAALTGADPDALCQAAGIEREQVEDADARLPGGVMEILWAESAQQTGDEHFGLHLGMQARPDALGILGYLMQSSATLEEALTHFIRYLDLFSLGFNATLAMEDNYAVCTFPLVEGVSNYLLRAPRHPMECTLAAFVTVVERLTGRPFRLWHVDMQHAAPAETAEYVRIFGTRPVFSAPAYRLVFEQRLLLQPVLSSDPSLRTIFEHHAQSLLDDLHTDQPYSRDVMRVLTEQFRGAAPSIDDVAEALSVSARSLQRFLQNEGTSYQTLLDYARKNLAVHYLRIPGARISEVSYLLGFSEVSAFSRAFKRWTGQAPSLYRG